MNLDARQDKLTKINDHKMNVEAFDVSLGNLLQAYFSLRIESSVLLHFSGMLEIELTYRRNLMHAKTN